MSDELYQEILEQVRKLGKDQFVPVRERDVVEAITKLDPHISVYQLDALVKELKPYLNIVR